jgi:hypothetical protein
LQYKTNKFLGDGAVSNIFIRETKESDFQELMNIDNMVLNNSNTPALRYWNSAEEYSKHYSPGSQFAAIIDDKVAGYIGYNNPTGLKSNSHPRMQADAALKVDAALQAARKTD